MGNNGGGGGNYLFSDWTGLASSQSFPSASLCLLHIDKYNLFLKIASRLVFFGIGNLKKKGEI